MSDSTPSRTTARLAAAVLVVLLLAPTATSAVLGSEQPTPVAADGADATNTTGSLTVVAAQGDDLSTGGDSRVAVIDTDAERVIWQTTRYSTYYDVDPLNESTLLYTAHDDNMTTYAIVHNWRTGEVYDRFVVAAGAHDVDYLGDGRYVYTDGKSHRVVVLNRTTDEVIWVYDFTEQFPPTTGGGPDSSYAGDFTHVNDVDVADDGSAFLVSPRNFDRVLLIDRETKETRWTLGEEDNYSRLYEQHNPQLVTTSPPTVLVADSENDRIVEYRRVDGEWTLVWSFARDLRWPRDADRLPNGNTLLVDTRYAMEVTPSREVVWRVRVPKFLYDVERIGLGDEPTGPPMTEFRDEFDRPVAEQSGQTLADRVTAATGQVYGTARWVLPWWVTGLDFWTAAAALVVGFVWLTFEARGRVGLPSVSGRLRARTRTLTTAALVVLGPVAVLLSVEPSLSFDGRFRLKWWLWDATYHTVGSIAALEAVAALTRRRGIPLDRFDAALPPLRTTLAAGLLGMGTTLAAFGFGFVPFEIQISDSLLVATVGVAGATVGLRRLPVMARSPLSRLGVRYRHAAAGVAYALLALAFLAGGTLGLQDTGAYLGFGLLFAVVAGRRLRMAAAAADAVAAATVDAGRYAFRLFVALLAVAVVLRVFGLGTIAGLNLGPEPLTLPNLTLAVVVVHELLEADVVR